MTDETAYTLRLAGFDLRVTIDPQLIDLVEHLLVRFYPDAAARKLREILALPVA